jgi:hypothetical protein
LAATQPDGGQTVTLAFSLTNLGPNDATNVTMPPGGQPETYTITLVGRNGILVRFKRGILGGEEHC